MTTRNGYLPEVCSSDPQRHGRHLVVDLAVGQHALRPDHQSQRRVSAEHVENIVQVVAVDADQHAVLPTGWR